MTAPLARATRALGFTPRTIDDAARTVELVASTGAGVERADIAGPFTEVLSLQPGAVDLSRLDGMPLLEPREIPPFQPQRWKSRWDGIVV